MQAAFQLILRVDGFTEQSIGPSISRQDVGWACSLSPWGESFHFSQLNPRVIMSYCVFKWLCSTEFLDWLKKRLHAYSEGKKYNKDL